MRNALLVALFLGITLASSVASACCCCGIRVRSVSFYGYRPAYSFRVAAVGFGVPYYGFYGYAYPSYYGLGYWGGGSFAVSWNRPAYSYASVRYIY